MARSKKSESDDAGRRLAVEAARLAEDRNAEDIVVLDLRGRSPVTDFFVIATGTSDRQIRSLADEIERLGRGMDQRVWRVAGRESSDWIVMDFVDVVVHLFNESLRAHYDLELIWGEAPRIRWRRPKRTAKHSDRN